MKREAARKLHELEQRMSCDGQKAIRLNKEKIYDGTDFFKSLVLEKNNTGSYCTFASSYSK